MKKLLVLTAFILFSGFAFSQTLQKGNFIGFHVLDIHLHPDVTLNQVQEFTMNKLIPEWEKQFGMKVYSIKGIRGENKYRYGMIYAYESVAARDKFWNDDGSLTELGNSAMEKMQPIMEEFTNKFGEFTYKYTDWVVQ